VPAGAAPAAIAANAGDGASPAGQPGVPAVAGPGTALAYEQQLAQARSLVAKDPARVAQVVKDWVEKDG
jgi:flagellar M-ring protein FliF